jgi:branched-subunit amino acid transport protein
MNIWLIILGMAAVTYSVRLLPLTTLNVETLPLWVKRALRYVPIAVLSAIVAPEYLPGEGWFEYTIDAHLWAGITAIAVAWLTHSTLLTIGLGMAVLLLLS